MKRYKIVLLVILTSLVPHFIKAQLNTEQVMIIGRNALYFEDYVLSIQYFNKVIEARPYLHEPYFFRALAKFNLEDYSGAEEDLTASIERNPYVPRSYQLRGLCRANLEKYQEAEADFRTAIKYDPQNAAVWQNLAVTSMKRSDWDRAAAVIDSMLIFAPRNTDAYLLRTQVAMQQNDTITAQRMIEKAVKNDEYSTEVYAMRAMLHAEAERYSEAEEDMNRAIDLMPGRSNNYLNRALIRYYQNNLRGAMDDYDIALYIDPHSFYGYYNRGLLRMQVGDDNRAIEDFDEVLEIDPDNTMARFNRALLRDATGDLKGAISDYSRVLQDYPDFEYGYSCRAAARRKVGDISGAEADEVWLLRRMNENLHATTDTTSTKEDKVRKRSDRNVRNYNKMVIADDTDKLYTTGYRGKVQNRSVHIELQPIFAITYYEHPKEVYSDIQYFKPLEDINKMQFFARNIHLTNNERALSKDEVQRHFNSIEEQSKNIADYPDVLSYRLARAMDFYLVQDFAASMNDLDMASTLEGEMWIVHFMRAVVRFKQLEFKNASQKSDEVLFASERSDELPDIDYRLVRDDLNAVISQMPEFAQAYYNRGNVSAKLNDFKSAVVDYSKAIELNDKLAGAFFNRGLARIYMGNTADGIADLSKAGELGIYSAYNVIKRFQNRDE